MDKQTADRNIYEYGCIYMNAGLGTGPCPPACTCVHCTHPYKLVRASFLSYRGSLTFDRLPAPPQPQHTHKLPTSPPPCILDSCQQGPGQRKRPICRLPSKVRAQGCLSVCVQREREGGRREASFHSVNLCCCSLSRSFWHTSEGYGCFKCRHP